MISNADGPGLWAAALREKLRSLLETEELPQLLFRIGYGKPAEKAAPRLKLDYVLME
jgi:hypothetical protein